MQNIHCTFSSLNIRIIDFSNAFRRFQNNKYLKIHQRIIKNLYLCDNVLCNYIKKIIKILSF